MTHFKKTALTVATIAALSAAPAHAWSLSGFVNSITEVARQAMTNTGIKSTTRYGVVSGVHVPTQTVAALQLAKRQGALVLATQSGYRIMFKTGAKDYPKGGVTTVRINQVAAASYTDPNGNSYFNGSYTNNPGHPCSNSSNC